MKFHRLSFWLFLLSHLLTAIGSSSESNPISFEEFYQFLRQQSKNTFEVQMGLMFMTASDGDEFYNFKESVSPNCARFARASMKIYLNFSTSNEINSIEDKALSDVYQTMNNTKELKHPLEFFCDEAEKQVLQHPTLSSIYLQVKNSLNTTNQRARKYFNKIFSSDLGLLSNYSEFFSIPGFLKATMQEEFTKQVNEFEAYNSTYNVLARAIVEVAKKGEYREKIDKIQEKVLSEINPLIPKSGNIFENFSEDGRTLNFTLTMMDKYEKYFNDDPNLRRELALAKKAIESNTGLP